MTLRIILLNIIILFCLLENDLFPCRPLVTEDTGTTEPGKFSLELSLEGADWENDDREYVFCGVLNYGLGEKIDVGLELPWQYLNPDEGDDESGLGDIVLRMKYLLAKESESWPAFLIKPTFKVPSGDDDKGLGSGKSDIGLLLVVEKSFDKLTGYFNAGYNILDLPKKKKWRDNTRFFGLGFQRPINERYALLFEVTHEANFNSDRDDDSLDMTVGMFYCPNEKVTWDFALGFGLSDASPDHRFAGGASINF
ncbi:MAG: transporter [Planctomycetes bacterium]|nr:transporter [Planctomycetota bacterium]